MKRGLNVQRIIKKSGRRRRRRITKCLWCGQRRDSGNRHSGRGRGLVECQAGQWRFTPATRVGFHGNFDMHTYTHTNALERCENPLSPPLDKPNRSRCASAGRNSLSLHFPAPLFHSHPHAKQQCLLFEWRAVDAGLRVECDRVPPLRGPPARRKYGSSYPTPAATKGGGKDRRG